MIVFEHRERPPRLGARRSVINSPVDFSAASQLAVACCEKIDLAGLAAFDPGKDAQRPLGQMRPGR